MRAIFAVALLLPSLARAQAVGGGAQMSFEALDKAPAGAWADYAVALAAAPKAALTMRYAVVGRSAKLLALEVVSQTPMGPMTVRMEFAPEPPDGWRLVKTRMKMGDAPAEDMPPPPTVLKRGDTVGELVGKETLTTPLGPLACNHYRRKTGDGTFDFWMNDKVLPIGLVKMADPRVSVLLQKTGSNAAPTLK
jgi:hypothetical protein